jgi:predicted sugar kinase
LHPGQAISNLTVGRMVGSVGMELDTKPLKINRKPAGREIMAPKP